MRTLIFGLLLLLFSIWIGIEATQHNGFVLLTYGHWSVETTTWVAALIIFVAFLLFYFLIRLINNAAGLSERYRRWKRMRLYRKARSFTNQGLCELAEGQWEKAEQTLGKAAKANKIPLINYLSAARAAQEQQAYERRDDYLRKAHNSTKGSAIAIGLTQAQLQIDSQQWEQALATLEHLHKSKPNHRFILKLLAKVYQQVNDWQKLKKLLPKLKKHKVLAERKLQALDKKISLNLLCNASQLTNADTLEQTWENMPRSFQTDIDFIHCYVKSLLKNHQNSLALYTIESRLKKSWDTELVKLYGSIKSESPAKQLKTAEHWLKKYPKEPELFYCLGILSVRESFWGKAREYLQTSIDLSPSAAAYYALGRTLEALSERDKALECYRLGLQLST